MIMFKLKITANLYITEKYYDIMLMMADILWSVKTTNYIIEVCMVIGK